MPNFSVRWYVVFLLTAFGGPMLAQAAPEPPSPRHDIRLYQIARGFVPETMNPNGMAQGSGFAVPNRWGQYTAYLMNNNAEGERTWRIEHYLPLPGTGTAQGSTMYLIEGKDRAVLIDTANPASFIPGVNDLKTVVRYLLGHENNGKGKAHPLEFVVANTHNHGDHIGENSLMSDRTVYFMDGDWPAKAPANYVPIREGGGPTAHANRMAVGEIDLGGGRVLKALAMPPHTMGSTGYLDVKNRMLFSGDAMGSGWPWLQWASISDYARTMHHVEAVTRAFPDLIVFPAHYYQTLAFGRSAAPIMGRALDRQYIVDQVALADGLVAGTIEGEPYPWQHSAASAMFGTAKLIYSPDRLAGAGETIPSAYHAIRLPGGYRREWSSTTPPSGQDINRLSDIAADMHIIRQAGGPSMFLIRGTTSALLIGTGSGAPGLAAFVRNLAGELPLDVVLLDPSRDQKGGLSQLSPRKVYVGEGMNGGTVLQDGDIIKLGADRAGRPLDFEAQTLQAVPQAGLTLRDVNDRLMFVGVALGRKTDLANAWAEDIIPFRISDPVAYAKALNDWSARTIGRYDVIYVSGSADWYLSANYVAELGDALIAANTGSEVAEKEGDGFGGLRRYRSKGAKEERARIEIAP